MIWCSEENLAVSFGRACCPVIEAEVVVTMESRVDSRRRTVADERVSRCFAMVVFVLQMSDEKYIPVGFGWHQASCVTYLLMYFRKETKLYAILSFGTYALFHLLRSLISSKLLHESAIYCTHRFHQA